MLSKPWLFACCCALPLLAAGASHAAQDYPNHPIRMIVPYPAGGSIDLVARPIAQEAARILHEQVIVDNRGGAGGVPDSEVAAHAAPDGYTVLMGNVGPIAISPSYLRHVPYDPRKDFEPVTQLTTLPFLLVCNPTLPVHNLKQLIALAKKRPGELNFASSGNGSGLHLAGEMLKSAAHINIVHVPYKGFAQAFPDLLSGQVELMFNSIPSLLPQVRAGKLRAIMVTATHRSPLLPKVPTAIESGLPGFLVGSWHGILVPAHTPEPVVARLHDAFVEAINTPEEQKRLRLQGAAPVGSTPAQFRTFIADEIAKWSKAVAASGVRGN